MVKLSAGIACGLTALLAAACGGGGSGGSGTSSTRSHAPASTSTAAITTTTGTTTASTTTATAQTTSTAAPDSAQPRVAREDRVIVADGSVESLAGYRPGDDPSIVGIARVFGPPQQRTAYRLDDGTKACVLRWTDEGIHVVATSEAPTIDPCERGAITDLYATGPGWRTDAGLEIGDDSIRILHLYPKATTTKVEGTASWQLVGKRFAPGSLDADVPNTGSVVQFHVVPARTRGE